EAGARRRLRAVGMGPARLFRFHRAHICSGAARLLRARAPLGQRGTGGPPTPGLIESLDTRSASALLDAVLAVLLAPTCASCHDPLERPTRGAVCPACWRSIRPLTPPLCDQCGDPLSAWRLSASAAGPCARCRRIPSVIT